MRTAAYKEDIASDRRRRWECIAEAKSISCTLYWV